MKLSIIRPISNSFFDRPFFLAITSSRERRLNIPRAYFGNIRQDVYTGARVGARKSLENKCVRETPDGVEAILRNIPAESDGSYCSREAIRYIGRIVQSA